MKIEEHKGSFSQNPTFGILVNHLLASKEIELKNLKQLQKSQYMFIANIQRMENLVKKK